MTRTTRCAVHSALSHIRLDSIDIALALLTAFDASRHSSLASMASWPGAISTLRVRFDDALVFLGPGMSSIVFGMADNPCMVRIALDDSRCLLLARTTSWPGISMQRVRFDDALVSDYPRAFLDVIGTSWYGRFAAQLVWLLSRSTW